MTNVDVERIKASIELKKRTFGAWLYYVRLDALWNMGTVFKVGITSKQSTSNRYAAWRFEADTKTLGLWAFSEYDKDHAKRAERAILRAFAHLRLRKHERMLLPKQIPWTECFRENIWQSYGVIDGERFKGFELFQIIVATCEGKQILPDSDD